MKLWLQFEMICALLASVLQDQIAEQQKTDLDFTVGSKETEFCASTLPRQLPSVQVSKSCCAKHDAPLPLPDGQPGFIPRLVLGTIAGKGGPPGFPTLKTLDVRGQLQVAGVEVLGLASKRESLVLHITVRIRHPFLTLFITNATISLSIVHVIVQTVISTFRFNN